MTSPTKSPPSLGIFSSPLSVGKKAVSKIRELRAKMSDTRTTSPTDTTRDIPQEQGPVQGENTEQTQHENISTQPGEQDVVVNPEQGAAAPVDITPDNVQNDAVVEQSDDEDTVSED